MISTDFLNFLFGRKKKINIASNISSKEDLINDINNSNNRDVI